MIPAALIILAALNAGLAILTASTGEATIGLFFALAGIAAALSAAWWIDVDHRLKER